MSPEDQVASGPAGFDGKAFVRDLTDGSVGDGQAAAFAMAVYFNGMDDDERVALTRAMANSGICGRPGSSRPSASTGITPSSP